MKFPHLSSFFRGKESATQDTGNARNRPAPETSLPPDVQPENTNRRHHRSASWLLKKLGSKREKFGMPAHASQEAPGPSNRQNNLPQVDLIHQPTFEVFHPMIKCGISLRQLKLNTANLAKSAHASVSIYENENGDKLIGKTIHNPLTGLPDDVDALAKEWKAHQTIYDKAGSHRNLVNAYGIAQMPNENGEMKRTMLMDMIPGKNGSETFDALLKCWKAGKISSQQRWGAIQFIGRRLLDVTKHLAKAGVVHNDIKPTNFMVNKETGEPVLIDLGLWSATGAKGVGGEWNFMSPELKNLSSVDERSDVFAVGASILAGVEKWSEKESYRSPNEGLVLKPAVRDAEGNMVRDPATYSARTAYPQFMSSTLEENKDKRVDSDKAKELHFLNDSMLDDDAAKEAIIKAMKVVSEEEQKPEKERWNQVKPGIQPEVLPANHSKRMSELLYPFQHDPTFRTLANYAKLHKESKINPVLKKYLNRKNDLDDWQGIIGDDAASRAGRLIADAPWFDAFKKITETVNVKSGVDENGARLYSENKYIDPAYESSVIQAKKDLESHVKIEDLRHYSQNAEKFLLDAMALKKMNNPEVANQLEQVTEQVTERAAVARRVVEIFETESTKLGKDEFGKLAGEMKDPLELHLEDRLKRQLERQLKRRK